MKIMTDRQADSLRDEGKIVLRVSQTESIYGAVLIAILVTAGLIFASHMEPVDTWQEYIYAVVYIILGYGWVLYTLFSGLNIYYILDRKGVTAQSWRGSKCLYWHEVKFVGSCSYGKTVKTIVSVIPLPEDEEYTGPRRHVSVRAYNYFCSYSRNIMIPHLTTSEDWFTPVLEMWEKYRDVPASPVVDESSYRFFPRKPRQ
ncbi:MAG: hypothetical protein E7469_07405 [Ruminococcaceae bacterium]|nr:hypothetical protein [Oscillospiraceae bacterium]